MTDALIRPPALAPRTAVTTAVPQLAECPLCHTPHPSLTPEALRAGGDWQCGRCGQRWDASRLANDAAYTAWAIKHDKGQ